MSEMEKRIARAIELALDNADGWPSKERSGFAATAALQALRIPTREMLDAANAVGSPESPALPHEVWPAMIDAAIAGKADVSDWEKVRLETVEFLERPGGLLDRSKTTAPNQPCRCEKLEKAALNLINILAFKGFVKLPGFPQSDWRP